MSIGCLVICFSWRKVTKKVPGSLIALIVGTVASVLLSKFAGIEFATIGSKFPELANGLPMPKPVAPEFDFETIKGLVSPAFTIAILCAIESLLAAMVMGFVTERRQQIGLSVRLADSDPPKGGGA
jgi:SulP family sulfate permease